MQRLDSLWLEITRTRDARAACDLLVRSLTEVLNVGAAILRLGPGGWSLESGSEPAGGAGGSLELPAISAVLDEAGGSGPPSHRATVGTPQWTGVPVGEVDPPGTWLLILPGAPSLWRAASWFEPFVRQVSLAIQLTASAEIARKRERLLRRLHVFTHRLARAS